jgi:putative transposase
MEANQAKMQPRLREIAAEHIRWARAQAGWLAGEPQTGAPPLVGEGLQRPTPRKQKRARSADGSIRRHQAEHPHQHWAMHFQFDATADDRWLKFFCANRVNQQKDSTKHYSEANRKERPRRIVGEMQLET